MRRRREKKKKILRRKVETESAAERRRSKRDRKRRQRRNKRNGGISPDLDSTGQRLSSSRQQSMQMRSLARKTTHMLSLSADGAMMTLLEDEEGMLSGQLGRGFLYRQGMGEHVCTMTASWN